MNVKLLVYTSFLSAIVVYTNTLRCQVKNIRKKNQQNCVCMWIYALCVYILNFIQTEIIIKKNEHERRGKRTKRKRLGKTYMIYFLIYCHFTHILFVCYEHLKHLNEGLIQEVTLKIIINVIPLFLHLHTYIKWLKVNVYHFSITYYIGTKQK